MGALSGTGRHVGMGENRLAWHPVHRPPGHAEIGRLMNFLFDGPDDARTTILLAHGAGAPMDSGLDERHRRRARRGRFPRRAFRVRLYGEPPDRGRPQAAAARRNADRGIQIRHRRARRAGPLIIGGKSMGGRVASMLADELFAAGKIAGLLCLGYPFHPPGKPEQLRTKHLAGMKTPALICQGTRDIFGSREEVAGYGLSDTDRDPVARRRRPRSEAAQGHIRLLRRRSPEDSGRQGEGVGRRADALTAAGAEAQSRAHPSLSACRARHALYLANFGSNRDSGSF